MDTPQLKKYFFAGVFAALATVLVAWQVGYDTGLKSVSTAQTQTPAQAKTTVGKIIGITGTTITVQPFAAYSLTQKNLKVSTNSKTIFERMIDKNQTMFQNELKAAQTSGARPLPYTLQKISLKDLRSGDTVVVTAAESILTASEFTATKITVEPTPPVGGATATSSSLKR